VTWSQAIGYSFGDWYVWALLSIPVVCAPRVERDASAEVLALLAGVDTKTADLIRRNLLAQIAYDELPPATFSSV
jgi:hypothetical protein